MKFIRYSKFKGFDPFGINLGDLMLSLSDSLLDSGYNENYWWTRQRNEVDDSLDALRQAILNSLLEQGILDSTDVEKMHVPLFLSRVQERAALPDEPAAERAVRAVFGALQLLLPLRCHRRRSKPPRSVRTIRS